MHILMPTDIFPPGSVGGAAWSAHTLATALINRGHTVAAIVPARGRRGVAVEQALGVPVARVGYSAPSIPFVENYFRHERFWQHFAAAIVAQAGATPVSAIHAQHVQAVPAAVLAGQRLGAPVVATVRDHWPWDYFATGLHGDRLPYPAASGFALATDLPARIGPLRGALALAALPYMLAHLRRRSHFLARCDAVIAVSRYIARRLAPIVPPAKIHVIPNMVAIATVEQIAATPPQTPLDEPFMLFVGKLERNKGAHLLIDIFRELQTVNSEQSSVNNDSPSPIPHPSSLIRRPPSLLIAGNGALRGHLERELAGLGVRARFLEWVDHDEVLRLMARCELLLFPSAWGEPLSRVVIEAAALGAPVLAMPTGGTPDIIADGVSGALAATPAAFARRLAALLTDPVGRRRLGDSARRHTREHFAVESVIARYERLYEEIQ